MALCHTKTRGSSNMLTDRAKLQRSKLGPAGSHTLLSSLSQFRHWLSQSQAVSCNITFPQHDPSTDTAFPRKEKEL